MVELEIEQLKGFFEDLLFETSIKTERARLTFRLGNDRSCLMYTYYIFTTYYIIFLMKLNQDDIRGRRGARRRAPRNNTETYEEIRAFCQEHHRQYQDANVTLKISALGIGNDVKTECLQEIIKIGSQRGFYDIFSEDDPLIHERVQTIIS